MYSALYRLLCMAYSTILRDLLKKAIDNPEEEWDEWTLKLMDNLFDYSGE